MPRIREYPEDFLVEEIPLHPPVGGGDHWHLWIEKRLVNTDEVAKRLAAMFERPPHEVAWAGRKDRMAVARQWLSIPAAATDGRAAEPADFLRLDLGPGVRILEAARHGHRLGVGELAGNRFHLLVREVDPADGERAGKKLDDMVRRGMPNRFGRQRFGRDGRNAERGRRILRTGRYQRGKRNAWLMVTALQSLVFNEVLDRRADALDEMWSGDVAIVHGTGDLVWVDDSDAWDERVKAFEASATGPIFGTKMKRPRGPAAVLEAAVLRDVDLPQLDQLRVPRGLRVFGDRRALRVRPEDVEWVYQREVGIFELRFRLPAGSYATVLLDELFPDGVDEGPAQPD